MASLGASCISRSILGFRYAYSSSEMDDQRGAPHDCRSLTPFLTECAKSGTAMSKNTKSDNVGYRLEPFYDSLLLKLESDIVV
jgi:hypothetical protein